MTEKTEKLRPCSGTDETLRTLLLRTIQSMVIAPSDKVLIKASKFQVSLGMIVKMTVAH